MLLNFFTIMIQFLIAPSFSKLPANKNVFLKKYIQVLAILAFVILGILLFVWFYPSVALVILGSQYSQLSFELFLNVAGSCIGLIGSTTFILYSSRGWALNPAIYVGISLISTIAGISFSDISTLRGVPPFKHFPDGCSNCFTCKFFPEKNMAGLIKKSKGEGLTFTFPAGNISCLLSGFYPFI